MIAEDGRRLDLGDADPLSVPWIVSAVRSSPARWSVMAAEPVGSAIDHVAPRLSGQFGNDRLERRAGPTVVGWVGSTEM